MTSISKNGYTDKLEDIVNKQSNTYHRTIKIKTVDVKSTYILNLIKRNNKEGPKFKVCDHVRISKYINNFQNATFQIVQKKRF